MAPPRTTPTTELVQFKVMIPARLRDRFDRVAARNGRSRTSELRLIMEQHIKTTNAARRT